MFAGWGSRVARLRWPVLIVALVAVIGSGVWGLGVFGQLTEGGYNDPRSESARAAEMAAAATGGQGGDVIAIYTPDQGAIDDAALTKRIKERLGALPKTAVAAQSSYWDKKAAAYASKDKKSAVAVLTLTGEDDAAKMDAYADIEGALTVPGAHVQLAGGIPLGHASSQRSTDDLAFAEMVSLPIVLILLLLIFGSLVAASLPVLVGGAAVLGSLGVLHVVALTHEVNSFAVNVASLLGLGMAIDYGLFMVGRFREEQAVHHTAEAVRRTVATAGRTVVFSATLLMTALAGLLLFPQGFLKSLAYGGLAAVFLAMLLSLTLLPALLAVLGPRVDLIPIRLPGRGAASTGGWEKLAGWVLRRPVLVAVPILAALLVLALPIAGARFGENDERQLPAGDPSRVAIETLKTDYPQFASDGVQVVVHAADGKKPDVKALSDAAAKVTGVEKITTTGGDNKGTVILTADLKATDAFTDEARDAVDGLRALTPPAGAELLVGGVTARNVDSLEAIGAELPLMIGLLAGATLVLMFLAFGSILLPVKAVVMSALSLTATFGSLVWIFQEGHGASWLDVTPTPLEAGIVVLMAAVVFGLSTDYEVFLLSRMVEARLRGATTREAVTIGLSRTGRVISAAALLLIVVTGAFALSSVTTMRFIGVGMIIALVLDATVVRVLLVPAVLALLGDASWWAPAPLRRLQEKAGLAEYAGEEEATGRHAWRPIDPSLEETTVLDGTLLARALPAAPAQAALPSGSETSNTVVLDYEAVLDYLSEKNQSSGTPSDDPILNEASPAPAEPHALTGRGRHRDALSASPSAASLSAFPSDVVPSSSALPSSALPSSAASSSDVAPSTSVDLPSGSSSAAAPSADSSSGADFVPSGAASSSSDAASSSSSGDAALSADSADTTSSQAGVEGDEEPEPAGPDDLWAEVEATLAAGAEIIRPDNEPSLIEAYTEANSPDDFDPSVTHVLHLPTEPSPDDPAATQVLHLPSTAPAAPAPADPSPEEPVIFSETVYNGLFTEETVRAATPLVPDPVEDAPEPDLEPASTPPADDIAADSRTEAAEPLHVHSADAAPADAPSADVSPIEAAETGAAPLDADATPSDAHSTDALSPHDTLSPDTEPADVPESDVPSTNVPSAGVSFSDVPFTDIPVAEAKPADISSAGSGPVATEPVAFVPDDPDSTPAKPAETRTASLPDAGRPRSEKSTTAEDDEVAYFLAPFADALDPATSATSPFDTEPPFSEPTAYPFEPEAEIAETTAHSLKPEAPAPRAFDPDAPTLHSFKPETPAPHFYEREAAAPGPFEPETAAPRAFEPEAPAPRAFEPETAAPRAFEPETLSPRSFGPEAPSPERRRLDEAASSAALTDATATEPVTDPFSWRDDPRLAAITAAEPDSFPWLDRYATMPSTPEPTAETPDTSRPAPVDDRALPHRPQTLDDWLTTAPPQSRPEPPQPDLTPTSPETSGTLPAPRPETLGDLPTTPVSPATRLRPASLADLSTTSAGADAPALSPFALDQTEPTRPAAGPEVPEPTFSEPSYSEPSYSEPSPFEPTSSELALPEPAFSKPSAIEPKHIEPDVFDEAASQATITEPTVNNTPANDPAATEPAFAETEVAVPVMPAGVTTDAPAEQSDEQFSPTTATDVETDKAALLSTETFADERAGDTPDPITATEPPTAATADSADDQPTETTGSEPAEAPESTGTHEPYIVSGETVIEPAADQPIEITALEPAEPNEAPAITEATEAAEVTDASEIAVGEVKIGEEAAVEGAEAAETDEVAKSTEPAEITATAEPGEVAKSTEPDEVDAWRDPTVLARSAISVTTTQYQPISGIPAAEPDSGAPPAADVTVPDEATTGEAATSPFAVTEPQASPEPAPVADDHDERADEPAHVADAVSAPEAIEDPVDEMSDELRLAAEAAEPTDTPERAETTAGPAMPVTLSHPRRPQTLDDWLASPTPLHRPRTLEDLPLASAYQQEVTASARPQTPGDVNAGVWSATGPVEQPAEADRNEPDFSRGRRPETLDDRIRGTVRPATLADHLPEQGRSGRRPANTGPSWSEGSGEVPYDRQTRRPASLADHPGPARPTPDPATDEPGPDPAR